MARKVRKQIAAERKVRKVVRFLPRLFLPMIFSSVFVVNFEHISHLFVLFLLLTLNK